MSFSFEYGPTDLEYQALCEMIQMVIGFRPCGTSSYRRAMQAAGRAAHDPNSPSSLAPMSSMHGLPELGPWIDRQKLQSIREGGPIVLS